MTIFNEIEIYRMLLSISIGALSMGVWSIIKVHISDHPVYQKIRTAKILLAFTYLIVIAFNFADLLIQPGHNVISIFFITTGMVESLLLVYFLTTLINPARIRWSWFYSHAITIVALFVLNLCAHAYFPQYSNILLILTLVVYAFQLIFYAKNFFSVYYDTMKSLKEYYEEDEEVRVLWVRNSFFGLIYIGILATLSIFSTYSYYILFIISYVTIYSYITVGFINRFYKYSPIIPTVVNITQEENQEEERNNKEKYKPNVYNSKAQLAIALDLWISEKGYLTPNVPMSEILRILDTTRPILYAFMKSIYGVDFSTWRNELRLQYAYNLLKERKDCTVETAAKESGFVDAKYFVHLFKNKYAINPKDVKNDNTDIQ